MKKAATYLYIFLTTLFALFLLNVAIHYAWPLYNEITLKDPYSAEVDSLIGLPDSDLIQLHKETWQSGWKFQAFTGFVENERQGRFVNVSDADGRRVVGGDPSCTYNVVMFGGSTTFGYNVTDAQTIASYLSQRVPKGVCVKNFGRGYYYSKMENALLLDLLERKYRIDLALFVDGLNEKCDGYAFHDQMASLFAAIQGHRSKVGANLLYLSLISSPVVQVTNRLRGIRRKGRQGVHTTQCEFGELGELFAERIRLRDAICDLNRIDCVTFLQPLAGRHGRHTSKLAPGKADLLSKKFDNLKHHAEGMVIDISNSIDLLDGLTYVDQVHYSPQANASIADAIFENIADRLR